MAYATKADLEARWRPMSTSETARANVLLDDAAAFLDLEFKRCGKRIDGNDAVLAAALKMVSCAIVKRAMANGADADITQLSKTAGSYSEQMTFANPTGAFYLTSSERNMLEIPASVQAIGSIKPKAGDAYGW